MYYSTFFALQVIIPSYWVVALIINIPCVMITKVDGTTGERRELWSKKWMGKTNSQLSWLLLVTCVPLTVMIGLYSRVVYKLWFKPTINTSNNPTLRQKVRQYAEDIYIKMPSFNL